MDEQIIQSGWTKAYCLVYIVPCHAPEQFGLSFVQEAANTSEFLKAPEEKYTR